jgi:hypothetical protein
VDQISGASHRRLKQTSNLDQEKQAGHKMHEGHRNVVYWSNVVQGICFIVGMASFTCYVLTNYEAHSIQKARYIMMAGRWIASSSG